MPHFRYHPDPRATGVVIDAEATCQCCGKTSGPFYVGPFYSIEEIDCLCLDCVSDGRAAEAFDGEFVDAANFEVGTIPESVAAEVTRRTPSYRGWQQEQWLVHCGDACAFLGYPSQDDVAAAALGTIEEWCARNQRPREAWEAECAGFAAGDAGFYKFGCLGCGLILFATDWN